MAVERYLKLIQENPNDDESWAQLFRLLADDGNAGHAVQLATSRHQIRQDGAAFIYSRVIDLVKAGKREALSSLYEAAGSDGAFRGLFAFGLALFEAGEFRLERTIAFLREAAYLSTLCSQTVFAHEEVFRTRLVGQSLRQASMLEDAAYAPLKPSSPRLDLPQVPGTGTLVFASCCETYLAAYAERFVCQLTAVWPEARILVHVLNASAEGEVLRADLREMYPQVHFSGEECRQDAAYYASRRLMIAGEIRAHYDCDLLLMDIDSVFTPDFLPILAASARADLAYFGNRIEFLPSLLVSAAYLYFPRKSEVADRFLAAVAAYLERKLDEPVVPWTVDQMALFRAMCLLGDDRSRTLDLTNLFPGGVEAIVAPAGHVVSEDLRHSRRRSGMFAKVEFGPGLRPILRPPAEGGGVAL